MTKIMSLITAFMVMSLLMTTDVFAAMQQDKPGDISIENPWARATSSLAKNGAAYLTIKNSGPTLDRLIAVESPVAPKVGAHQSLMTNGMMEMRSVPVLDIPAGGQVMFKPGSYHIMFMGLRQQLKVGEVFPLTLTFEKAGKIKVMVTVMKMGATGSMPMKPSSMSHSSHL